jgi:2-oxoisovalerate dehydrogenase E2 component (dihydrolipoyl transacylase)
MSIDFILPDIGEGIVECEVVDWLVAEGDIIAEDQPVADVMTDKALVQIPSMYAGVVDKLYYEKGDIAKVHAPLFSIKQEGEVSTPETAAPMPEQAPVQITVPIKDHIEDFILPDIGEGIVECEVVDWLVAEGDLIKEDQPVCDVMTDKALVQIPSKYNGKVVRLYYEKGETAIVHQPLFAIHVKTDALVTSLSVKSAVGSEASVSAPAPVAAVVATQAAPVVVGNGKAVASPAVRRLAREKGIDITQVAGSGKKGRVYKEDLAAGSKVPAPVTAAIATPAVPSAATAEAKPGSHTVPVRGIQAAMVKVMTDSVRTIPHFTYCDEVDMTKLIALRSKLKDKYAKQNIKLTMMPFFMKSISLAVNQFPVINSQPNEGCTEITYFDDHNIGMAVDSKYGLLVPNVKQCQNKSIIEIAEEVSRLTLSAREGRVNPSDLRSGTITISNIGAIGGTIATPIINKPQVAIVALGKVQRLPRFNDKGEVEARTIMQISWSGDHRVIDGGTIARFCNLWKDYLEDPTDMLVAMS